MSSQPLEIVFVASPGRSGSTLCDRLLGEQRNSISVGEVGNFGTFLLGNSSALCSCGVPYLTCPFWSDVLRRWNSGCYAGMDAAQWTRLKNPVQGVRHLPHLLYPACRSAQFSRQLEAYRLVLETLFRAIAEVSGCSRIIDSSKGIPQALVLREIPGFSVNVLHLVRDPRGVAASWKRRVPDPSQPGGFMPIRSPAQASLRWMRSHLAVEWARRRLPVERIRYEDLCRAPLETLKGLTLSPAEASPANQPNGRIPHQMGGNPVRYQSLLTPHTVDDRWKRELSTAEQCLVFGITWPLMVRYGYC